MKDGKIGFINVENEVVIPFRFDYSDECGIWDLGYVFHDGYCVMTDKDGKLGIIDSTGRWVTEPLYDEILPLNENGYRIVITDGRYGIFDAGCNVVYPAEYNSAEILSDGFVLCKDGKKWQVDFDGNVVKPFIFDSTTYLNYPTECNEYGEIEYAFSDYMKYEVMNCCGIMNRITGEPVTPAVYHEVNMLSKDLFEVRDPETYSWCLVDACGNPVLPE